MAATSLPETHKALVLKDRSSGLSVQQVPTPQPTPGSAIVRILSSGVLPYAGAVYSGERNYPFPEPIIPGSSSIGRVAVPGPDATKVAAGDLVFIDCFIRARDDQSVRFLPGIHNGGTPGGKKLMEGEFRDWTYAEYAKVPLENCTKLDGLEDVALEKLSYLQPLLVVYGGVKALKIRPGDRVIVAPATGHFGGAAVEVALALGAKVVAAGRNIDALNDMKMQLKNPNLVITQLTGDLEKDTAALGPADSFIDISPPAAGKSPHRMACIQAMKTFGRVVFWGGVRGPVELPYDVVVHKNLTIKGIWMYDRDAPYQLVKMVQAGALSLDSVRNKGCFPLEEWKEAFDAASKHGGWAEQVLLQS